MLSKTQNESVWWCVNEWMTQWHCSLWCVCVCVFFTFHFSVVIVYNLIKCVNACEMEFQEIASIASPWGMWYEKAVSSDIQIVIDQTHSYTIRILELYMYIYRYIRTATLCTHGIFFYQHFLDKFIWLVTQVILFILLSTNLRLLWSDELHTLIRTFQTLKSTIRYKIQVWKGGNESIDKRWIFGEFRKQDWCSFFSHNSKCTSNIK